MFRIKVCGIRNVETAKAIGALGVDAVGLNFYPKSRRYLASDFAKNVADAVPSEVLKVGLFVNQTAEAIVDLISWLNLNVIQLHGDETPDIANQLAAAKRDVKIIRAVRISPDNLRDSLQEIEQWNAVDAGESVGAFLLDPWSPKQYGGTGKQIDWKWLASIDFQTEKPIVLAGGLTPQNVAQAIEQFRPTGVDVAGGVENPSGEKDLQLIRSFVEAARNSFNRS